MSRSATGGAGRCAGQRVTLACAVTAIAAAFSLAVPHAIPQESVSQEDAHKQLLESQRNLKAARTREKQLSGSLAQLEKERAALNKDLIETAKSIQISEASLTKIEKRVAALTEQENQVRASIAQRQSTISELLAAMQRIGRQPPPAVVTRRNDALKMVRSAMLMASVFPELTFQAEGLSAELDDLVRLSAGIRRQRDNLKTENDKLIAGRTRIDGLIKEKQALVRSQQRELKRIRVAAAQHAKTVGYLGELVKRMDKEIAEAGVAAYEAELAAKKAREKALAEAAKRQGRPVGEAKSSQTTKVAFVSPGRLKPAVEFSSTKGRLALPVSGEKVRAFGGANEYGQRVKGISIRSRSQAQVTSPVDGWIAYADEFRTYGQLLIINAGEGYHILLAGMERIDVETGQFVLAGEPVAVMGAAQPGKKKKTKSPSPVLYIEFRKDGRPIDPDPWWADNPGRAEG
ncbi:MAG: peptidoglycan DD-metalloendopeptidase family protein [Hyphomicrobiaceae bacterium]|nr:peptidoglycan DD-metalloendopeptidase family protein [Hyphomicrobiaceae bacterium]